MSEEYWQKSSMDRNKKQNHDFLWIIYSYVTRANYVELLWIACIGCTPPRNSCIESTYLHYISSKIVGMLYVVRMELKRVPHILRAEMNHIIPRMHLCSAKSNMHAQHKRWIANHRARTIHRASSPSVFSDPDYRELHLEVVS